MFLALLYGDVGDLLGETLSAPFKSLVKAVKGALLSYQWLARNANDLGRLQWSIVNKMHSWGPYLRAV